MKLSGGLITIRPGARGVDFSFAKPPPRRLVELGFDFVVGYISVPPASAGKNISAAQCQEYLGAGLKVLLVWEMSATRPNLGASYGTIDGIDAKRLALARNYPVDVPILVAVDTNTVVTNTGAQERYVRAFAEACVPFRIGIYGDIDILQSCRGLWQIAWVPNAWAWSGGSRAQMETRAKELGAHVLQRTGYYIDDKWAVDPNDTIAAFPAWGLSSVEPPTQEDDVTRGDIYVIFKDDRSTYCWMKVDENDRVRQIASGNEYQRLLARGFTELKDDDEVPVGEFRQMVVTWEPVGDLNANSSEVLGESIAAWWAGKTTPLIVLPGADAPTFPRNVTLEGTIR